MQNSEVRQIHTRHSARVFGVDITNRPLNATSDTRKSKLKKPKPSLATQWLHSLPEVHPYLSQIQDHTRNLEHENYIPADFMSWHSDINPATREILMGWLVEMHNALCGNQHTLYLAVLITDKYCHGRFVAKSKYQLLGITALFIAAKYEEIKTPKLKQYHHVCGGAFTIEQILAMESDILLSLNFKIKAMTSCWHLEEYFQFAGLNPENGKLCLYILDLSLVQYGFCLLRPSLLSWSIVLFVIKMRNLHEVCQQQISKTFHLAPSQLKQVIQLVEGLFRNRRHSKFKSINEKYIVGIHNLIS